MKTLFLLLFPFVSVCFVGCGRLNSKESNNDLLNRYHDSCVRYYGICFRTKVGSEEFDCARRNGDYYYYLEDSIFRITYPLNRMAKIDTAVKIVYDNTCYPLKTTK